MTGSAWIKPPRRAAWSARWRGTTAWWVAGRARLAASVTWSRLVASRYNRPTSIPVHGERRGRVCAVATDSAVRRAKILPGTVATGITRLVRRWRRHERPVRPVVRHRGSAQRGPPDVRRRDRRRQGLLPPATWCPTSRTRRSRTCRSHSGAHSRSGTCTSSCCRPRTWRPGSSTPPRSGSPTTAPGWTCRTACAWTRSRSTATRATTRCTAWTSPIRSPPPPRSAIPPWDYGGIVDSLEETGRRLLPDEPALVPLLQTVVFETLITAVLIEIPNDPSVITVVRDLTRDDAVLRRLADWERKAAAARASIVQCRRPATVPARGFSISAIAFAASRAQSPAV